MSSLFLAFVENFYGESLGRVAHESARIRGSYRDRMAFPEIGDTSLSYDQSRRRLEVLLRPREFVSLYRDQVNLAPRIAPALKVGELRPVFGRAGQAILGYRANFGSLRQTSVDHEAALRAMFGTFSSVDGRELKSALLYAHSCLLVDPFTRRPALDLDAFLEGDFGILSSWGHFPLLRAEMQDYQLDIGDRLDGFCDALQALSVLEDLIVDGSVTIVTPLDPHLVYFGDERSLTHDLMTSFYFMGLSPRQRGGPDERAVAEILKVRAKEQVLGLLAYGEHASVFAGGRLDELAFETVLSEMVRCQSIGPMFVLRTTEDQRLTKMAELDLPGVDQLAARDMVAVRKDDLFETFRADVRVGLSAADQESDLAFARAEFAMEMRAASQRLGRAVSKKDRFSDALGGDTLGWVIGAIGGWSIDGWRGSILGLAAKGVYEFRRSAATPGPVALRNHYVALS